MADRRSDATVKLGEIQNLIAELLTEYLKPVREASRLGWGPKDDEAMRLLAHRISHAAYWSAVQAVEDSGLHVTHRS